MKLQLIVVGFILLFVYIHTVEQKVFKKSLKFFYLQCLCFLLCVCVHALFCLTL